MRASQDKAYDNKDSKSIFFDMLYREKPVERRQNQSPLEVKKLLYINYLY